MDHYANFSELNHKETEGVDFRVDLREGRSGIAIVAPHGGKIERGTSQIANAIAGANHSYYSFEGIKPTLRANRILHITSNNFDEPRAQSLVTNAQTVMTIHGAKGMQSAVYAGGLDMPLRQLVLDRLNTAGFVAEDDPSPSRQGRGANNICNRGLSGQGLQLELTLGLRQSMFRPIEGGLGWTTTQVFSRFVEAIRRTLDNRNP